MEEAIIDALYLPTHIYNVDRSDICNEKQHEGVQHTAGANCECDRATRADSLADQGERIHEKQELEAN